MTTAVRKQPHAATTRGGTKEQVLKGGALKDGAEEPLSERTRRTGPWRHHPGNAVGRGSLITETVGEGKRGKKDRA